MNEDELKRAETWAVLVHEGGEPARFAVYATTHDLTAEVRRLQRSLGEAVAANLCHVSLKADEMLSVEVVVLRNHVDRLRGLIAEAESDGNLAGDTPACPWCRVSHDSYRGDLEVKHEPDCPAFSGPGVVR
jgi:hypothetical protein